MTYLYLFIAISTFMALPPNDWSSGFTDRDYTIIRLSKAIFWPFTLTAAFIRFFFGLDR